MQIEIDDENIKQWEKEATEDYEKKTILTKKELENMVHAYLEDYFS